MRAGCGTEARCMAFRTLRLITARQSCNWLPWQYTQPLSSFNLQHGVWQSRAASQPTLLACFSTSTSLSLPRSRFKAQQWPSFRNESPELRFVRDHNLFDPSDEPSPDTPRLADPGRRARRRTTQPVQLTSTANIERELLHRAVNLPPSSTTINLLEHLIFDRSAKPNTVHYEALILANASPEHGSADNLRQIWREMEQQQISFNVNIYTAILRTLVVHPDVEILVRVLESCEKMWIELDLEMLHYIAAIYIRVAMPDLALSYLDRIEGLGDASSVVNSRNSGKAELWLYVMFVHHLTIQRDWDGVLRICYRLNDDVSLGIPFAMRQIDVPYDFWSWILQQAVEAGEPWVSLWVWETWVDRAWIKPNRSVCRQMLQICAEHGLMRSARRVAVVLQNLYSTAEDQERGSKVFEKNETVSEVNKLLQLAVERATPDETRLTSHEEKFPAPYWTMFKKRQAFENEFESAFRFDPWAKLSERTDAGRAWPRILQERQDAEIRRQEHKAEVEERRVEQQRKEAIQSALQSLPSELLHDIDAAANAEPEFGEHVNPDPILRGDLEVEEAPSEFDLSILDPQLSEPKESAAYDFWPRSLPNLHNAVPQSSHMQHEKSERKTTQPSAANASLIQSEQKKTLASYTAKQKEPSQPHGAVPEVVEASTEPLENADRPEPSSSNKDNTSGRGRKRGRRSIEALERRAYRIAMNRAGERGSSADYKKHPNYKSLSGRQQGH